MVASGSFVSAFSTSLHFLSLKETSAKSDWLVAGAATFLGLGVETGAGDGAALRPARGAVSFSLPLMLIFGTLGAGAP
jgi:hypothetical protein